MPMPRRPTSRRTSSRWTWTCDIIWIGQCNGGDFAPGGENDGLEYTFHATAINRRNSVTSHLCRHANRFVQRASSMIYSAVSDDHAAVVGS